MITIIFNDGAKFSGETYQEVLQNINKQNPIGSVGYTKYILGFANRVKIIRGKFPALWSAKAFCESLLKLGVISKIIIE